MLVLVGLGLAASILAAGVPGAGATEQLEPVEVASFVDPTARIVTGQRVDLEERVFVGPFAQLVASRHAGIHVGPESNVQDNVVVVADADRPASEQAAVARLGLSRDSGVVTGERVILAHGSSVRGPARLGVGAAPDPNLDSGVFVSFGARVDGAIIERDSGLSALSRVGPGVTLHSGFMVLPGKDVRTQDEADDPALRKVRPILEADRAFNAAVVEVNVGLAREYTRLEREDPSAVRGINVDPGGNTFNEVRDTPRVGSSLCTGPKVRVPQFRDRIIGAVCFQDSLATLDRRLGSRISLRADEGEPFAVGTIERMRDGVVFHALEESELSVGNRVTYGRGVIVHGGSGPATVIRNDVRLGDGAVVFRSLLPDRVVVGTHSAVIGSELAVGQVIPPRTIYAANVVFGSVEW